MPVRIVTDSVADLPPQVARELGITLTSKLRVPMSWRGTSVDLMKRAG